MKKSLLTIVAENHRAIVFAGTLLCLVVFGIVAWQTNAQNRERDERRGEKGRVEIESDRVETDDQSLDESARDSPPDTTSYWRQAIAEDHIPLPRAHSAVNATVVDIVVNNTNTGLATSDTFGDSETNIAIDPTNPTNIVITAFSGSFGPNSPFWHSTDGGLTWTKRSTFPSPPGVGGTTGCPCDQSVDYGRGGRMSSTVLTSSPTDVYSGFTTDPTSAAAYSYFLVSGVAKRTNSVAVANTDQPWLLVNRDPALPAQDNVYVAYDDFSVSPRGMRVAVSAGASPSNFTVDNVAGFGPTGTINPGHRLAVDPGSGAVYSLFQQLVQTNGDGSRKINFMLNRSTDGGATWTLNGSTTGIIVTTTDSNQPTPKFGTVNALLGGVLHATVDPTNGDVYYVYGNRDAATGNNRLAIRRLTNNGAGGLTIGPEFFVTNQVQAALPSVAVNSAGIVGVFYMTFDGTSGGFPQFSAHFVASSDHGQTFPTNTVLETFLSSAADNGDTRQRVLGDYHQLKAVGTTFYGSFTGNGVPFGRTISNHDPIFYKVTVNTPLNHRPYDFDGDGKTDLSIFRPAPGEWWWNKSSNGGNGAVQFGTSTDKIVASDYTGDGKADVAFWRPATGQWFILRSEDFSFFAFPFGSNGDIPAPADYDGDGKADATVFRPSTLTWFISKSTGGTQITGFGATGDLPATADYDGDGKSDIAIYRANGANSEWWVQRSTNGSVYALQFGLSTDKAVPGDYTGDGKADIAVYRPSTGVWSILRSENFSFYAFPFGAVSDLPTPGDYDGDGMMDAAVFRPSNSTWYANRSTAGTLIQQFGIAGDRPVPNALLP